MPKKAKLVSRAPIMAEVATPAREPPQGLPYAAVVKGYLEAPPAPPSPPPLPRGGERHLAQPHDRRSRLSSPSAAPALGRAGLANRARSEFPSLSNNSQLNSANQASMWSSAGSRSLSGPVQRSQLTPVSTQQGSQDDIFSSAVARMSANQGLSSMPRRRVGESRKPCATTRCPCQRRRPLLASPPLSVSLGLVPTRHR